LSLNCENLRSGLHIGLIERDLAKRLNMTPQQLNDILKGRAQLTGEQALALLEFLDKKA